MMLRVWLKQTIFYLARKAARLFYYYPKIAAARARRWSGKTSFILDDFQGSCSFDNGRYAIFLLWQPNGLPWYVRNALEALAEAQVNVIAVVNHHLSDDMRAELVESTRHVLIRDNTGFDIGGYKDGTAFVRDTFSVQRLVYINDSIYYFREGLTELFGRLVTSEADVCAPFENWELRQHVQSFCFSMSTEVFEAPAVVEFWNNYLPVSSRLWAIQKGELGLSEAMIPNARSMEIIYTPNIIRAALETLAATQIVALNTYLPIRIRIPRGEHRAGKTATMGILLDGLSSYSQIHTGGFLYRQYAGNPLVKRDLVWRNQYSIYDVEYCLNAAGHEGHLKDILSDMRRKGNGEQLPLLKRVLFSEGLI